MVNVLVSNAVYRGFKPWSGQTKAIKLVFVVLTKNTALSRKIKDWLTRNQDNMS